MLSLRNQGAYRLPSGTRLIARENGQGGYDLYDHHELAWGAAQAKLRVQPDQTITFEGKPTVWRAADLIDTGATVPEGHCM